MSEQPEKHDYVKDSKVSDKPDVCPECGGTRITACPGGSKLKAVPGIWWKCEDCSHEW